MSKKLFKIINNLNFFPKSYKPTLLEHPLNFFLSEMQIGKKKNNNLFLVMFTCEI